MTYSLPPEHLPGSNLKRRFLLPVILLILACGSTAQAQTFDLINARLYEPVVGTYSLQHARSLALGGAYTAQVRDGTALWYNPGALARITRVEVLTGVDYTRTEGETLELTNTPLYPPPTVEPMSETISSTRLDAFYVSIPLEGTATGWTLGFGTGITNNLDRVLRGDLTYAPGDFVDVLDADPNNYVAEEIHDYEFSDDQRGTVRAWQFGIGGKISPRVMVGGAVSYNYGSLDFTARTSFSGLRFEDTSSSNPGIPVRWDINTTSEEKMHGWGAHAGFLWRPGPVLTVGGTIRSPVVYTIDNDQLISEQRDQGTPDEFTDATTRKLKTPLSVSGGLALSLAGLSVAGDAAYTDWSQLEYTDTPLLTQYNDSLRLTYSDEFVAGVGAELAMFQRAVSFRAGARYRTLPYADNMVASESMTYSAGIGFIFDRAMALDIGASMEDFQGSDPVYGFDEKYTRYRVLVTAAYRFD